MKFHKFFHCGMAQADMTIGITERLYPDKKDVMVVRLENQGCFGAYVRLRDIKGQWHNFSEVEGFELALCGSDERDAFINLMRTLIEQHEANKACVEVEYQVSWVPWVPRYTEDTEDTQDTQGTFGPLYNGLFYDGMQKEPDSDVYERLFRQDTCLPEDED